MFVLVLVRGNAGASADMTEDFAYWRRHSLGVYVSDSPEGSVWICAGLKATVDYKFTN